MIKKLFRAKDRLINRFYDDELQPIMNENWYHSPEESETDEENDGKRKIAIKDLKWRSSTVSI
jgi:hypothetical protein